MDIDKDSLAELVERLMRRSSAYLDLISATTEEEFEFSFTAILESGLLHLERNKRLFAGLTEEGLSAVLAASLTGPGMIVTQETNSNGHVDLTIEADHCSPVMVKLCEAKIYAGPSYHIKGIAQLLGRYTTGRETRGLLLSYVRKPNIKDLVARLRAAVEKRLPENQIGPCQDHVLKWSFVTKHKHSSGEELALSHVGCNMHV